MLPEVKFPFRDDCIRSSYCYYYKRPELNWSTAKIVKRWAGGIPRRTKKAFLKELPDTSSAEQSNGNFPLSLLVMIYHGSIYIPSDNFPA